MTDTRFKLDLDLRQIGIILGIIRHTQERFNGSTNTLIQIEINGLIGDIEEQLSEHNLLPKKEPDTDHPDDTVYPQEDALADDQARREEYERTARHAPDPYRDA